MILQIAVASIVVTNLLTSTCRLLISLSAFPSGEVSCLVPFYFTRAGIVTYNIVAGEIVVIKLGES